MNTRKLPLLAFALPVLALAQTEPTAADSKNSVVQLSPFEVTTSQDTGFAATDALAGGRLRTDLKDTPVAYSVITRDFIDALGITDLSEAADWSTNSYKFWDGTGGGDTFNITVPIAARGIVNPALRQRNFFLYYGPMDSFDVERYDFGRGPNQVLYGNGTIGGTAITMTKRARFDKPFAKIEESYGSWNDERVMLDANTPIGDKAAVRAAAVWENEDGWRLNQMEKMEGAFATASYKLTPNTEIRLEGETGQMESRTPYAALTDQFGGWDGKTIFAGQMTDAIRNGTAPTANGGKLTSTGQPQGVDRRGSNYFVYDPFALAGTVTNYQNDPMTRGAGATALTPADGYLQVGSTALGTSGASLLHTYDVPGGLYDTAIANSDFRLPGERFTNAPKSPTATQNFKDLELTISQNLGDSLYFEVAGDINRDNNALNLLEASGLINTYIDINKLLPSGAPNPKFLQPYGDGQYRMVYKPTNAEAFRYGLAYVKDAGKWGNYQAAVQGGMTHQFVGTYNKYLQTGTVADHRAWANGGTYGIRVRQYWDDPHPFAPPATQVTFNDPISGTTSTINPFWAYDATSFNNENEVDNYFNYVAGALNAKFFKDRWIILAADRFDFSRQDVKYTLNYGDYPANWTGTTVLWRPAAPKNWDTLMYVPKDANGNPIGAARLASARPRTNNAYGVPVAQAQYAGDLFQDDFNPPEVKDNKSTPSLGTVVHVTSWMSLSYNYAKAFLFNTSAAPDPNNQLLPPVVGSGWDASVRLTFLDNRVTFIATQYADREYGNYIDPSSVTNSINSLYNASPLGVTTSGGGNIRGAGLISSVVRDTRTRISDGYEFESVLNLTRGWRAMLNFAMPRVWQKNYAPVTRAYVASHGDLFRQILQDDGGIIGPDGVTAIVNPAITPGVDTQNAVNAYNTIYNNIKNFVADLQMATTSPYNGNVFTDYTFQGGWEKGIRLGIGMNYRGPRVVGYRGNDTIVNPSNPTQAIDDPAVDAHNGVWAGGTVIWTGTAGYTRRLKGGETLGFNLRISNLFNNRTVVYTDNSVTERPRNGDYTSPARQAYPNSFAYQLPISWYGTMTLGF